MDVGGPAAQTGSAIGEVLELYHKGHDDALAIARCRGATCYPEADWRKITTVAEAYIADPRNARDKVMPEFMEYCVSLVLPAHPMDPTGKPIEMTGRIDLVRNDTGRLELWDYKMSGKRAAQNLGIYYYQQAIYLTALRQEGRDVYPGGLICLADYLIKDVREGKVQAPLFHRYELSAGQIEQSLELVKLRIAELRRGEVYACPGEYCEWCALGGVSECVKKLTE